MDVVQKTSNDENESELSFGRVLPPSYRLVYRDSGRPLKYLVASDRLKAFCSDRTDFYETHPCTPEVVQDVEPDESDSGDQNVPTPQVDTQRLSTPSDTDEVNASQSDQSQEQAIKIVKQRTTKTNGVEYLVLYGNKEYHWSNWVSPNLLAAFRLF